MIVVRMATPTARPTPTGPPRGVVAEVAVDEADLDGEHDDLDDAVEDVDRRQVEVEVVVVEARRHAEHARW